MVNAEVLQRIRAERNGARLERLRRGVRAVQREHGPANGEVLLFGSLARGDWDGLSDVDLLVIAEERSEAEALADALLSAGLGDDVLAFDRRGWQRRRATSPYWQAIAREALPLLEVES